MNPFTAKELDEAIAAIEIRRKGHSDLEGALAILLEIKAANARLSAAMHRAVRRLNAPAVEDWRDMAAEPSSRSNASAGTMMSECPICGRHEPHVHGGDHCEGNVNR